MMIYYPLLFPIQFRRSVEKSYAQSGYADRRMAVDFYEDGLIERTGEPAGAFWEDVGGFYETETMFLLLLDEQQAVVVTKESLGDHCEAFRAFAQEKIGKDEDKAEESRL